MHHRSPNKGYQEVVISISPCNSTLFQTYIIVFIPPQHACILVALSWGVLAQCLEHKPPVKQLVLLARSSLAVQYELRVNKRSIEQP